MNRLLTFVSLFATILFALLSCDNAIDEERPSTDGAMMHRISVSAANESRTYIDEAAAKVHWSEGDAIKVLENESRYATSTSIAIDERGCATFEVEFPSDNSSESFSYAAIYPAARWEEKAKPSLKAIELTPLSVQHPVEGSFDPNSDILISKVVYSSSQPDEITMQFRRIVAMARLTLQGLECRISRMELDFDGSSPVAPYIVNMTTGEVTTSDAESGSLVLEFDEAVSASTPIYFTTTPLTLGYDDSLSISIECEDGTIYRHTIDIPEERTIPFVAGDLTTLSVDLSSEDKDKEEEEKRRIEDGDYVVLAHDDLSYYALSDVDSGAGTKRLNSVEVSFDPTTMSSFTADNNSIVWHIESSNGYYLLSNSDGKYLSWESGNSAYIGDEKYLLDIVATEEGYQISSVSDSTRILAKNSNQQYPFFAFYAGSGLNNLRIVPAVMKPAIAVNIEVVEFEHNGGEYTINVERRNGLSSDITATVTSSEMGWLSIEEQTSDIFVLRATQNTSDSERNGFVTLSADGADKITIVVVQSYAELPPTPEETQLITNGDYVIATSGKMMLAGATTYREVADISTNYVNGRIVAPAEAVWSVAYDKENECYTIYSAYSDGYISWTSGNTAPIANTAEGLTITKSEAAEECYNVAVAATPERRLQYYAGSPRFAFYTSSQRGDLEFLPATAAATATPSEAWLELPAERVDKAYPNAAEYKVMSAGERNYTTFYDTSTYTSMWVAYPLESRHMGTLKRPDNWSFNPLISTSEQVNLCSASYSNSDTYSRGHLIPNASRNGIQEMQLQTFYVTNSVPQVQTNFNGGVWMYLEAALQSLAKDGDTLYIVTGVLFEKEGESRSISYTAARNDASKQVPIPNYFYKVALKVSKSGDSIISASTIGFWFENKEYSESYDQFTVSVDDIESWSGFDFFANLPDNIETSAESNTSWSTFQNF